MPILEVDRAKSVVVLKRGQGKGFSGLENPLFFQAGNRHALWRRQRNSHATDPGSAAGLDLA